MLSEPIARLIQSALRIGHGDLTSVVPGEKNAELGVLAQNLESMRVALFRRDEQLRMMLAGVAHEVKNPLGGIELFAGLLSEELQSSQPELNEARNHAQKINKELQYLKRIVDDFLSFAREQKLQWSLQNSEVLLREAARLLTADAIQKNVSVSIKADALDVWVDESLFTGALVNLLKNAIAASLSGQRVQLIGTSLQQRYQIEVIDEGTGIAPDKMSHIFEPFFTTKEQGTGLGLPLTKKVIEAHHGTLGVESRAGRTIFTIAIPISQPVVDKFVGP